MRLLLLFTLFLVGTNASIFTELRDKLKDIGHKITNTLEGVGEGVKTTEKAFVPFAKDLGKQLLTEAKSSGLKLVSTAVSDLIANAFGSIFHLGRDTGIIEKFVQFEEKIKNMVHIGVDQVLPFIHNAVDELDHLFTKVGTLDFDLPELEKSIVNILSNHHIISAKFLQDLESNVFAIGHKVFGDHKRAGFMDTFKGITDLLKGTFSQGFQKIGEFFGNAGTTLKAIASNVVQSVKSSATDLGTKLAGHLVTLKQHGANLLKVGTDALSAIKDATGDILGQTVQNVAGTLANVGKPQN